MRLLQLSANQSSFRTIRFNRQGLSLILGRQSKPQDTKSKRTYNGVGKSLAVFLVQFCLGAKASRDFTEKLKDWEFSLTLELGGHEHTVSRRVDRPRWVVVDDAETSIDEFTAWLGESAFHLAVPVPGLTFRRLIKAFARPTKAAYETFDSFDADAQPYERVLALAHLLGLDVGLVSEKAQLKKQRDELTKRRSSLRSDDLLKGFFAGDKNPAVELKNLEAKITDLRAKLKQMRVANDFHEKEREADAALQKLQLLRNERVLLEQSLGNIGASLESRPDVTPDDVFAVFAELEREFPQGVRRKVDEVVKFHRQLIEGRAARLTADKHALERRIAALDKELARGSEKVDSLLVYVKEHTAFEEYLAVSDSVAKLDQTAQRLRDYKNLEAEYTSQIQALTARSAAETVRATEYLRAAQKVIDSNLDVFRSFSSRLYPDKAGGLSVSTNEGDNQSRFDIRAYIEDDASDGINEAKIFCFDWTILTQQWNHDVSFLVHDSRLFSEVDVRQRAELLKIAAEVCKQKGLQYIASFNEDALASLEPYFPAAQWNALLGKSTVLTLTDESPASKLLGFEIDLKY